MKYVRESQHVKGAKDTYTPLSYQVDHVHPSMHGSMMIMEVQLDGTIGWRTKDFQILNIPSGKIPDPNWSQASKPPKPAGFLFEDPSTWGGLMWEEIPLVDDTSKYHFDFMQNLKPLLGVTPKDITEEAILRTLIKSGDLPVAPEGEPQWEIVL